MKILSVEQIKNLDTYTIENEPISSINLMERASEAFVEVFSQKFAEKIPVWVFCGLGNNGGDGLAIACLLLAKNYQVSVCIVRYSQKTSEDFALNYQKISILTSIHEIRETNDFPTISSEAIIIDALFGSGLNRPLTGLVAEIIQKINQNPSIKVAVDVPSGLFADQKSEGENILRADYTISFQLPKLAFLLPQNADYLGDWQIIPIGLHESFIADAPTNYFYLDTNFVQKFLKKRPKYSHKGTYGHALLLVGSLGKMGAAVLASRACLRAGVGLLSVQVPRIGYEIMQNSVPEAMILLDKGEQFIESLPNLVENKYSAIGVGCGLDKQIQTLRFLTNLLKQTKIPLVLDADALNLLAENPDLLELIPPHSILTPHPKEFERLTRPSNDNFERLTILQNFAQVYQVFVVLKGANSAIATPEGKIYFNSTGNAGMATGGSGDVLTGIITGLLTQNYNSFEAAILGVYLHGLAGDLALESQSQESLIASDLIENLGKAFKQVTKGKKQFTMSN